MNTRQHTPAALVAWLYALAAMVVAIVVIGGITRLTESGLSITQWKPITGIVPPLNEAQWQAEFAHYRQIDQYAAIHSGMDLARFKGIFFWEYIHRLLARLIGTLALAGWAWFALRRTIPRGFGWRLLAVPLLIGVQGLLGWLMVASGLKPGMVEVAPGWLAAHLLTALFALAYIVWTLLDLTRGRARLAPLAVLTGAALAVQLLYGALMAGLRAGLVTDQWPLMNGTLFPGPSQRGRSLAGDLFADPAVVHFIHRWWAWVVVALLIVLARRIKAGGARREAIAIHAAFGTQILLGIATVMTQVPLPLAALHQLVGALLVVATVCGAHALGRRG
jgi:cytochrome c oxidase assembly protein subunit 15